MASQQETPEVPDAVIEVTWGENRAYAVIDTSVDGYSCGGLRISPKVSLSDLVLLAKVMSKKCAFWDIGCGGAKFGIRLKRREDRDLMLGLLSTSLRERWKRVDVSPDMGSRPDDLRHFYRGRIPQHAASPAWTATGVVASLDHPSVRRGKTAIIDGLGAVASGILPALKARNVKVIGVATSKGGRFLKSGFDSSRLRKAYQEHGRHCVDALPGIRIGGDDLLRESADMLIISSIHHRINRRLLGQLNCDVICPVANSPLTPGAVARVPRSGIQVLPDLVVNSGGVLGGILTFFGFNQESVSEQIKRMIQSRLTWALGKDNPLMSVDARATAALESRALTRERATRRLARRLAQHMPKSLLRTYWKIRMQNADE